MKSQSYQCRVCGAIHEAFPPDVDPPEMVAIKTTNGPKITVEWECLEHQEKKNGDDRS